MNESKKELLKLETEYYQRLRGEANKILEENMSESTSRHMDNHPNLRGYIVEAMIEFKNKYT